MSETTKLGHPSIPDALNSRNDQDSSDFWGVTFWSAIWVSSWTFALFGRLHFFWYCSARSMDATMCYYTLCASEIFEFANPPEESQFSTQRTAKHSFDWSERTQGHTYYSVPVWFMSSIPFNQLTATKSFSDGLVRPCENFHSLGSNEIVRARADPWRDWQILNEIVCVFPNTHTHKVSMLKSSLVGSPMMCPWLIPPKCAQCADKKVLQLQPWRRVPKGLSFWIIPPMYLNRLSSAHARTNMFEPIATDSTFW